MGHFRGVLIPMVIAGLIAGGCQSSSPTTINEYRPARPLSEQKVPESGVFVLLRWTPIAPVVSPTQSVAGHPHPARQMPVEVEQVYVRGGRTLGFRRSDGQLIAVADQTVKPLTEAHYEWRTLPAHMDDDHALGNRRLEQAAGTVLFVAAAVGVVALVLWLVHVDRHSLLDDLLDSN